MPKNCSLLTNKREGMAVSIYHYLVPNYLLLFTLFIAPIFLLRLKADNRYIWRMQSDGKWVSSLPPQRDFGTIDKITWISDKLQNYISSSDGGNQERRSSLQQKEVERQTRQSFEAFKSHHKPSSWPDMRKTFCPVPDLSQSGWCRLRVWDGVWRWRAWQHLKPFELIDFIPAGKNESCLLQITYSCCLSYNMYGSYKLTATFLGLPYFEKQKRPTTSNE